MADKEIFSPDLAEALAKMPAENLEKLFELINQVRHRTGGMAPRQQIGFLEKAAKAYATQEEFKVGDLVTWKDGLRDRAHPLQGFPAVVVEVLDPPVVDGTPDAASSSFKRKYDLVCGVVLDGVMYTFHFQSKRLTKFRIEEDG